MCSPPESGPLLVMLRASCFKALLIYAPQTNLTFSHQPQQYGGLSFRIGLCQALRSIMSLRFLDPLWRLSNAVVSSLDPDGMSFSLYEESAPVPALP